MKKIKWKHRQWSDMCLICVPTEKKKKKKTQSEKNYLKPNRRKLPENKDLNV